MSLESNSSEMQTETYIEELVAGDRNPSVPEACTKQLSEDREPTP